MKQVLQSSRTGTVSVEEVPAPEVRPNGILVRTAASLISSGTERASLDFSRKPLLAKAWSRPDLVRQVLEKAKRDGFVEAARVALSRLDRPLLLGYSCAGTVIARGPEAREFQVGDRVACAGAGHAGHAEVNYIPRNLAVPLPVRPSGELLSFEEGCYATLGAIALHAVRLGSPGVGERAAVVGLGLVGLLAGQILCANGCRVLGVDPQESRRAKALDVGFDAVAPPESALTRAMDLTRGLGVDLVLITASSQDSGPAELAAGLSRDRGRVVAVGTTGLDLPRRDYYQKELSLVVSRSYGPGRYDANFEEKGQDYPHGYVRWTERENLRAFLELVAAGKVVVDPLTSDRIPIDEADRAYALLNEPSSIGVVIQYPGALEEAPPARWFEPVRLRELAGTPSVGRAVGVSLIGAGHFARDVLLPVLRRVEGVTFRGVVTRSGSGAKWAGDKHGFAYCASRDDAVWEDADTRAVVIATRNHSHADLVKRAIAAGKAVFVEKPLCVTPEQLEEVVSAYREASASNRGSLVMVGFNRRFAPLVRRAREFFADVPGPRTVQYRINAGPLPPDSWVRNPAEGGGRIVSEVCHFVDLSMFLLGGVPHSVYAQSADGTEDDVVAVLKFPDGSLASVAYHSKGDRAFPKERIEIFGAGRVAVIDDFGAGWFAQDERIQRTGRWRRKRKGHREEMEAFIRAVREGGESPVPFGEAVQAMRVTFALKESLSRGVPVEVSA